MNLHPFEQYSDKAVIAKILAGEIALYEIIIRRYNPYLFRTGRSYGFNHQDTEDLMQETYISAYTHLAGFEGRSSFKTWLVTIMLNHCYRKKQQSGFQKEIPAEDIVKEKAIPMFTRQYANTDQDVLNKELAHVLENALQRIPESYRMVFTLRELNEMSIAETATALHITEGNVKIRLNRAKGMLRSAIARMYSPADIFEFNLIYCDRMVENVMKVLLKS